MKESAIETRNNNLKQTNLDKINLFKNRKTHHNKDRSQRELNVCFICGFTL